MTSSTPSSTSSDDAPDLVVARQDEPGGTGRYELRDGDDVLAQAAFEPGGDGVVAVTHTTTDPARTGQGLGSRLVSGLLEDLRSRGERVRPDCPFVASYLGDHPDQQDLLADA